MAKLSVIHYNWPGFDFDQFLGFAADSGYGFVELFVSDVWDEKSADSPEHKAEAVKKQVESHGLRVSALGAGNDFVQIDSDVIATQVERMRRICGLARILDPEAVIRSEGGNEKNSVSRDGYLDAMYQCFSRCVPFAEELQIGLAVDNHGTVTNDGDLLFALLQKVNSPYIGTNLDTMNYRWMGHDLETCDRYYKMMAPHTLHVHLKDGFDSRENYRGAALGDGEIHMDVALQALREAGYQGAYCAEYEGPEAADGVGYAKCAKWMQANL